MTIKTFTNAQKFKLRDLQYQGMITKLPFVRSLQLDHACIHKTTQGCHENLKDIFFPYAIICMHSVHVMTFARVVVNVVDESHCREELTYSPLTDSFNC